MRQKVREMFDKNGCSSQLMLLFGRYYFMAFIIGNVDRIADQIPNRLHEHAGNVNAVKCQSVTEFIKESNRVGCANFQDSVEFG